MIEPSSSEEDEEEVPDAPGQGSQRNGQKTELANGKGNYLPTYRHGQMTT